MLDIVIDAAAAYRVTRLIVDDTIVDGLRARVREANSAAGWDKLNEGLTCYWCVGFWVAGGVVAARKVAPVSWSLAARALAISAAVGLTDLVVHKVMTRHG